MWVNESAAEGDQGDGQPGFFDQVTHMSQAAMQSGGFAYDEETLTRIANRWQTIAEKARQVRGPAAFALTSVKGPGLDEGSGYMADKANNHGQVYVAMMEELQAYSQAQDDECRKALGTYQENEDETQSWLMQLVGRIEDEQQDSGGGFL